MKVRHGPRAAGPIEPEWPLALILGATAVATLALTRNAQDVPLIVGPVLLGLRAGRRDDRASRDELS